MDKHLEALETILQPQVRGEGHIPGLAMLYMYIAYQYQEFVKERECLNTVYKVT